MENVLMFFKGILPTILVSLFTAWITVNFAINKFYSEKWWEKKLQTYSDVLENLSKLKYIYNEKLNAEIQGIEFNDEVKKNFKKGYLESIEALKKASAIGSFLLSVEASNSLNKLTDELDKDYNTQLDYLDHHVSGINECLYTIRESAKKDLQKKSVFRLFRY